jgi:hypothetical protein
MTDGPDDSQGGERTPLPEDLKRRRFEIPAEALERLGGATVPVEFASIARDLLSEDLAAGLREEGAGPERIEEQEAPRIAPEALFPPEAEGIQWAGTAGFAEPEEQCFTLGDLKFDLRAVVHFTPGLLDWEDVALERVVTDTYPVLLVADDDGEEGDGTKERTPPPPDPFEEDGPPETETDRECIVSGKIIFEFTLPDDVPRPARVDRLGDYIALPADAWFICRVQPNVGGMGRFPGELTWWFERDGNRVPLTKPRGNKLEQTGDEVKQRNLTKDNFEKKLREVEKTLQEQGMAFRVYRPRGLSGASPTVEETITGFIQWRETGRPDARACTLRQSIRVRWFVASRPQVYTGPDKNPGKEGYPLRVRTEPQRSISSPPAKENPPSIVAPLEVFWEVGSFEECCGEKTGQRVIQFARALLESGPAPYHTRGKDWSLDIRQDERERAQADKQYDPTFTNKPGARVSDRTFEGQVDGRKAVVQFDAPGMAEWLYNQLLLTPVTARFIQQFIAFLVCEPKKGDRNLAQRYLDSAKLVKIVQYSVVWTFEGPDPAGNPRPPKIEPEIQMVIDTNDAAHAGLRCKPVLEQLFRLNGLLDSYRKPPPSELKPLSAEDHEVLKKSIKDLRVRASE